jgi:hypothetical protein
MKIKFITPIEYYPDWVLAIGTAAPWNRRVQIRVPKFVARWFL